MSELSNVFAWPVTAGYMTIKPLTAKSPCKVWLIRRESDQSYMVLKLSDSVENLASMRQEHVISKQKYVVDFYGVLSTQLGDGLLMEYCPGGSIASLVQQRSPFSLGEAVTALAPIAQTVSGFHRAGMRHGDISPANIMLTAQGMPKIIDFQESSVRLIDDHAAGTPGFIAPEITDGTGERNLGDQDVYALGACLWYLLTGEPPQEANCRPPVSLQFPDQPEMVRSLLADSLSQDPQLRPSADQFAKTLFASAKAEPIGWEGHIDPCSNNLMETIHPNTQTERGVLSRLRAGKSKSAANSSEEQTEKPWNGRTLRATPGRLKITLSVLAGIVVVGASLAGVNVLSAGHDGQTAAQAAEAHESDECRIAGVAQVPACALETDTIISSFLKLSSQRDQAMVRGDFKSLAAVYSEDSEQLKQDLGTLKNLKQLHLKFEGLSTKLEEVRVVARGQNNTVLLSAKSTLSSYKYVMPNGQTQHSVAAGESEQIEVQVALIDGAWRLGNVLSRQK